MQKWFSITDCGRYILRHEKLFYHNVVARVFGYYSLQIEFPQINFLQGNKISNHYVLNKHIKSELTFLPFADNSIDLIICPHVLEFTPNYHYLLQECYRVLIPNGKIIFTCFNNSSIFKAMLKSQKPFKNSSFINLNIIKSQLNTLNFDIEGGKFFCYVPPINNKKILSTLSCMEKLGDRWIPTLANVFAIVATKKLVTHTLIKSKISISEIKLANELSATCTNNSHYKNIFHFK